MKVFAIVIFLILSTTPAYSSDLQIQGEEILNNRAVEKILRFLSKGVSFLPQLYVNHRVKRKANRYHKNALTCLDLERTNQNEINEFFARRPKTPHFWRLYQLQKQRGEITQQAMEFSTDDKEAHCAAGYLIAERINEKAAIFTAYFKEAQDVGDCNPNSHFEYHDEVATILGSKYYKSGESLDRCYDVRSDLP